MLATFCETLPPPILCLSLDVRHPREKKCSTHLSLGTKKLHHHSTIFSGNTIISYQHKKYPGFVTIEGLIGCQSYKCLPSKLTWNSSELHTWTWTSTDNVPKQRDYEYFIPYGHEFLWCPSLKKTTHCPKYPKMSVQTLKLVSKKKIRYTSSWSFKYDLFTCFWPRE